MALIGSEYVTYADYAQKLMSGGNKEIGAPIEMLSEVNPILDDMPIVQCNNGTTHKTLIRTGLPDADWRSLNRGIKPSKSESTAVEDKCGQLASMFQVDEDLVKLYNNTSDYIMSEEVAFVESFSQKMSDALFYGNFNDDDAMFLGLAPRYPTLNDKLAATARNVISARPATDTSTDAAYASVWLINWGPNTVHGIYPEGLEAGFTRNAHMNTILTDRDGREFPGHKIFYKWNLGLTVRDWRSVVRIANISQEGLDNMVQDGAGESPQQVFARLLILAGTKLPRSYNTRPILYMNQDTFTMLSLIAFEKGLATIQTGMDGMRQVQTFNGVPIKIVDALKFNEEPVVSD